MGYCMQVAAATGRVVLNILRLYFPYILTRSRVQAYYHIIPLQSSVGVHAITSVSIGW